jgi:hypothetical protein
VKIAYKSYITVGVCANSKMSHINVIEKYEEHRLAIHN